MVVTDFGYKVFIIVTEGFMDSFSVLLQSCMLQAFDILCLLTYLPTVYLPIYVFTMYLSTYHVPITYLPIVYFCHRLAVCMCSGSNGSWRKE